MSTCIICPPRLCTNQYCCFLKLGFVTIEYLCHLSEKQTGAETPATQTPRSARTSGGREEQCDGGNAQSYRRLVTVCRLQNCQWVTCSSGQVSMYYLSAMTESRIVVKVIVHLYKQSSLKTKKKRLSSLL